MPGKPRKRYGKPLDLLQLKTLLSEALRYLSRTLDQDISPELKLRACSAMAANAGVYRQLLAPTSAEGPGTQGEVILIHGVTGSNGQHGD